MQQQKKARPARAAAPALRGRILAAPSWVFPGSIAENCAFLADRVQEVGLLFMESAAALAYGQNELGPGLAALPLSWHVHLPADLDWANTQKSAALCLALMDKLNYLGVKRAVLHPPARAEAPEAICLSSLREFMLYWERAGRLPADLLLENQTRHSPAALLAAARASGASICLDLAHLLISGHTAADLPPGLMRRARLLHLCAPGPGGSHHRPLGELDAAGADSGRQICRQADADAVFMLELFQWPDYVESLAVLNAWME